MLFFLEGFLLTLIYSLSFLAFNVVFVVFGYS